MNLRNLSPSRKSPGRRGAGGLIKRIRALPIGDVGLLIAGTAVVVPWIVVAVQATSALDLFICAVLVALLVNVSLGRRWPHLILAFGIFCPVLYAHTTFV